MVIHRAKELRNMPLEELDKTIHELRFELMKERGKVSVGGVPDNPGRIRELRRTIARALTIKRERVRKNAGDMS